jgi:hypothetical protein
MMPGDAAVTVASRILPNNAARKVQPAQADKQSDWSEELHCSTAQAPARVHRAGAKLRHRCRSLCAASPFSNRAMIAACRCRLAASSQAWAGQSVTSMKEVLGTCFAVRQYVRLRRARPQALMQRRMSANSDEGGPVGRLRPGQLGTQ